MIKRILEKIDKVIGLDIVEAHCDIPCGIYDPYIVQYNAHTVLRMTDLINSLNKNDDKYYYYLSRYIATKDEYAEKTKHELRILWGDYFKPSHVEQFPELTDLIWNAMRLASKARQHVDEEAAKKLLETTLKIAEIFWKTKGMKHERIPSPYPTQGELVVPVK